jgi:hypothetical protein
MRPEISDFQQAMSRRVTEDQRGNAATLYDLDAATLEEARQVDRSGGARAAVGYLRFHVANCEREHALLFLEDVLRGGQDSATWETEDRLVGLVDRDESVTLDVARAIRELAAFSGERWFRIGFTPSDSTKIPIDRIGPGIRYRNMKYWSRIDLAGCSKMIDATRISGLPFVPIEDDQIAIEMRRWIASCAAWWARSYLASERSPTAAGIVSNYARPVMPSADG